MRLNSVGVAQRGNDVRSEQRIFRMHSGVIAIIFGCDGDHSEKLDPTVASSHQCAELGAWLDGNFCSDKN